MRRRVAGAARELRLKTPSRARQPVESARARWRHCHLRATYALSDQSSRANRKQHDRSVAICSLLLVNLMFAPERGASMFFKHPLRLKTQTPAADSHRCEIES